jgi:hypothetical protein
MCEPRSISPIGGARFYGSAASVYRLAPGDMSDIALPTTGAPFLETDFRTRDAIDLRGRFKTQGKANKGACFK